LRSLFAIFSFLSLLLLGAAIAMWVYGKWRDLSLTCVTIDRVADVRSLSAVTCAGGRIMLWDSRHPVSETDKAGWDLQIKPSSDFFTDWRYLSAGRNELYCRFGLLGMVYLQNEMQ